MTATNAEIEAEMKLRAFGESISAIYKSEYEVDEAVVAEASYADFPSAPSPASMPEVLATDVVKYDIRCIKEKDSILLKIKDNITNRDYRITIHGKDNDIGWSSFKKYYQNDFEKFYQSLELCIEGNTNGLTCNIIEAQNEVIMEIKSSIGLFIWHYSHQIVVPIEENEVEVLKNKNEELVNRLNEMEKKMNDLFEFIDLWITGKPLAPETFICDPGNSAGALPCIIPGQRGPGTCMCQKNLRMLEINGCRFHADPQLWSNMKKLRNWEF